MKNLLQKSILALSVVASLQAAEIYATFDVKPAKSASLAFDASGVVKQVNKEMGDEVKKGEVIASLDNRDKAASLESAKTTLKFAKKDYERQKEVKKLIDASQFDAFAYKYENAKNQLTFQEVMYDKTFLKAPFDGVIYFKDIEVGDTVNGMMLKTVYKVQSKHDRKLIVNFDQKYHANVKVGDTFKYKIDGDPKEYSAKISKIYPLANANNRKIQAEVLAKDIVVGLFGDGTIITKD